jgi:hypothetical protein
LINCGQVYPLSLAVSVRFADMGANRNSQGENQLKKTKITLVLLLLSLVIVVPNLFNPVNGQVSGKYTPILTLTCSPNPVDKATHNTVSIWGYLTLTGGVPSVPIHLSIFDATHHLIESVDLTTTPYNMNPGYYAYQLNVDAYPNGGYIVQVTYDGDDYLNGVTTTMEAPGNLFVVPEYSFVFLSAITSCFAAFVLYKRLHRFQRLIKNEA